MRYAEHVCSTAVRWYRDNHPVVIATIGRVRGSSSQPVGTRMAIRSDGVFVGAVSGGCVEADVARTAEAVFRDGMPRLAEYRQVTDSVLEVGLNCDGQIEVVLELLNVALVAAFERAPGTVLVTRYRPTDEETRIDLNHEVMAAGADDGSSPVVQTSDRTTGWRELREVHRHRPVLLIVSAGTVAWPLARMGRMMGYEVVLSDPREAYATHEWAPEADRVVCAWPRDLPAHVPLNSDTVIVSLNHEPRFEDDLFRMLMDHPDVRYIGALGKRKRHEERLTRQDREGYDLARLPRIHTPIGHDLGGAQPEEIALAIMAEIVAHRNGRPGGSLSPG